MRNPKLSEVQIELFCKMIGHAFLEIRSLTALGFSEQANALADAFHTLPFALFHPDFSWERTRRFIESYQLKYPIIMKDGYQYGSYHDYKAMLNDIETLEEHKQQ